MSTTVSSILAASISHLSILSSNGASLSEATDPYKPATHYLWAMLIAISLKSLAHTVYLQELDWIRIIVKDLPGARRGLPASFVLFVLT